MLAMMDLGEWVTMCCGGKGAMGKEGDRERGRWGNEDDYGDDLHCDAVFHLPFKFHMH